MTTFNFVKVCIGISFLAVPKAIAQGGIYGALVGGTYIFVTNWFAVYLLVKARNRFKKDEMINDITDLAARLYGEGYRWIFTFVLFSCNMLFLMCYVMFFGDIFDILVCKKF